MNFWPVFVGLCELPPNVRDSIRNKLIAGIYFGKTKPKSDMLFETLINEINELDFITVISKDQTKNFKIKPYGLLVDTPAKCLATNMKYFNGYYGCTYCLNPGGTL